MIKRIYDIAEKIIKRVLRIESPSRMFMVSPDDFEEVIDYLHKTDETENRNSEKISKN